MNLTYVIVDDLFINRTLLDFLNLERCCQKSVKPVDHVRLFLQVVPSNGDVVPPRRYILQHQRLNFAWRRCKGEALAVKIGIADEWMRARNGAYLLLSPRKRGLALSGIVDLFGYFGRGEYDATRMLVPDLVSLFEFCPSLSLAESMIERLRLLRLLIPLLLDPKLVFILI